MLRYTLAPLLLLLPVAVHAQDEVPHPAPLDQSELDAASAMCAEALLELPEDSAKAFCRLTAQTFSDQPAMLRELDRTLDVLTQPSPYRWTLMHIRGLILAGQGDERGTYESYQQALEESNNLPPIMLAAVRRLAFTTYAQQASEYWLELIATAPDVAREVPAEAHDEILNRLRSRGQMQQAAQLIEALEGIGYVSAIPRVRSDAALLQFSRLVTDNDAPAARRALRNVIDPQSLMFLSSHNYYRAYWDDIAWNTPEQRTAVVRGWVSGLAQAATSDRAQTGAFLRAANEFVGPEPLIAAYEQTLLDDLAVVRDPQALFDLVYWVTPLANAHQMLGDVAGAERLYQQTGYAYRAFPGAARLNVDVNYARMLAETGNHARALAMIDTAIAQLTTMDPGNLALLPMHAVRVRALHGLNRLRRNDASMERMRSAAQTNFGPLVILLLQIDRFDEARELVLGRLRQRDNFRAAMELLQPGVWGFRTADGTAREDLLAALRADPAVRRAVEPHGRLLDHEPIRLTDVALPVLASAQAD